jgi:hypothetical protein
VLLSGEKMDANTSSPYINKIYVEYSNWIGKMKGLDKEILEKHKEKMFVTYDTVESFFKDWMGETSENRRKYIKLLSDILRLIE